MENPNRSGEGGASSRRGAGVLKDPVSRRNLLFSLTLLTICLVFIGAVPLGEVMMKLPLLFAIYWAAAFTLVMVVLGLAFYDLSRVRRDHVRQVRELDKETAAPAEVARRLRRESEREGE